ncbi:MAG: YIP1 family protein [Armatimonadota bacterium]|jgi:hypothetical protein
MTVGNLPPIEEPQAYGGYLRALWRTWVFVCLYPYKFFEAVGNSQNLAPALLFGFGCWFILGFIGFLITSAFLLSDPEAQKKLGLFGMVFLPCSFFGGASIMFFIVLFYGSILHLCLILFGGAKQGLGTTLRVVAYAQAPMVYFCGIWSLVLYMIGLQAAHRTDAWRSILAVLVSQFLCCIGGIFLEALTVVLRG